MSGHSAYMYICSEYTILDTNMKSWHAVCSASDSMGVMWLVVDSPLKEQSSNMTAAVAVPQIQIASLDWHGEVHL